MGGIELICPQEVVSRSSGVLEYWSIAIKNESFKLLSCFSVTPIRGCSNTPTLQYSFQDSIRKAFL
jgi:hypothetical protein